MYSNFKFFGYLLSISIILAALPGYATDNIDGTTQIEFNRGIEALKMNQFEDVIQIMTRIISQQNYDPSPFTNRGIAYLNLERYDEAIADFRAAIAIDPLNELAYLNLGVASYNVGDLENANAYFNQSIILIERKLNVARFQKIDDDIQKSTHLLSTARQNRGIIRYAQNRYQDSIEDFNWVIQHSTEDEPLSYYLRGMAYQAINRQEDACQDYSYAFSINNDVSGSLGTRIQEEQKKCLR